MPKVEFKYDISKDGWNILRVIDTPPFFDKEDKSKCLIGIDKSLVEKVKKEKDLLIKKQIIKNYLANFLEKEKKLIKGKIKSFSQEWNKINNTYFDKLSFVLNITIPKNNIYTAYLTNAGSCPFNVPEGWFMVRIKDEKVDAIAAHEIMHIEFVRAYGFFCKDLGLPQKRFNDLRESLTVLLNEEFEGILSRPDYGYKEHKDLRNQIIGLWRKDKNIKHLIKNVDS
ncbi:MAG: hypothetical protein Athens101410_768 [Parcubacteria group bacterium Athens1014_10]|nr:MAG: hypothetical protein Athens101410_768 [Parcubacteria group bacterium Athens1014_10]TSD04825.1 MAG: hypothetical protein Athens071412_609 [Parcubacteria group bacterium Athens0714_12]